MDNCCNSTNVNINLKGFAPCRRPLSELMTGDLPHRLRTNVWEWVVTGWGGDGEVTGWSRLVMGWCEGAGLTPDSRLVTTGTLSVTAWLSQQGLADVYKCNV